MLECVMLECGMLTLLGKTTSENLASGKLIQLGETPTGNLENGKIGELFSG